MEFVREYGLLIAVALPCAVIFAINVLLALTGERGTLLLPSLRPYPPIDTAALEPVAEACAAEAPADADEPEALVRKAA